ncbi:MAG: helix-turn-helix domain-containing protein [Raineya sp.]|jgi:AraC-like DNA-binding protein|nr:helix-turn-helix domain-containing protein [Raineya sp.]
MSYTLINPQNGHLAFKVFSFEGNNHFDHVQRLGYYSMILVLEGSGKLKADFSDYTFQKNTLMCFSPYQPFMIDSSDLQGVCLNFHPDFFCIHKHQQEVACNGVLFNNIYNPPFIQISVQQTAYFVSLIEQMKEEMQNIDLAQYELIISHLKIFLIKASRIKIEQNPEAQKVYGENEQPFILQNLKEAIEIHFKVKHSASEYADLLNISSKSLAKICKNYFNKTLTDLISERIIIEAKRELYMTSKTVKEIAYELGYQDEYYFSRFFKTNADVSPQIYRETVGFAKAEA